MRHNLINDRSLRVVLSFIRSLSSFSLSPHSTFDVLNFFVRTRIIFYISRDSAIPSSSSSFGRKKINLKQKIRQQKKELDDGQRARSNIQFLLVCLFPFSPSLPPMALQVNLQKKNVYKIPKVNIFGKLLTFSRWELVEGILANHHYKIVLSSQWEAAEQVANLRSNYDSIHSAATNGVVKLCCWLASIYRQTFFACYQWQAKLMLAVVVMETTMIILALVHQ